MILQQTDSVCHHTQIKIDLLKIKEMCYKNSYLVITIFELFRNYIEETKLAFDYSWHEKEIVVNIKSLNKNLIDDFKEHLPAYLEYTFKDFLTPDILEVISVHTKQRTKYEEHLPIIAHFKCGMNACRLEHSLKIKEAKSEKSSKKL